MCALCGPRPVVASECDARAIVIHNVVPPHILEL